jgi:hypothetical protein
MASAQSVKFSVEERRWRRAVWRFEVHRKKQPSTLIQHMLAVSPQVYDKALNSVLFIEAWTTSHEMQSSPKPGFTRSRRISSVSASRGLYLYLYGRLKLGCPRSASIVDQDPVNRQNEGEVRRSRRGAAASKSPRANQCQVRRGRKQCV